MSQDAEHQQTARTSLDPTGERYDLVIRGQRVLTSSGIRPR